MGDISAVLANLNIDGAESAATVAAGAREILLLESAEHIKMARAQRALYQEKVSAAVDHAKEGVDHCERTRSSSTTDKTWSSQFTTVSNLAAHTTSVR